MIRVENQESHVRIVDTPIEIGPMVLFLFSTLQKYALNLEILQKVKPSL